METSCNATFKIDTVSFTENFVDSDTFSASAPTGSSGRFGKGKNAFSSVLRNGADGDEVTLIVK